MCSFLRFLQDAGGWGVASVLAAFLFFGISLWEHAHDKPVSAFVFVCLSVPLFWLGAGLAWLKEHRQLEPRLVIGDPDYYSHNAPRLTHCYRVPISNRSGAKTIRNVGVQLVDIQPKPEYYPWGSSLPLQWKDSLKPEGSTEPFRRYRDVRAGNPEEMDFVQAMQGDSTITVNHSVDRISEHTIPLPPSTYRITLEVKGDDVPPTKAAFEVWMDKHGKLQCVSLGSS
jgi:hypothetical protein